MRVELMPFVTDEEVREERVLVTSDGLVWDMFDHARAEAHEKEIEQQLKDISE